MNNELFRAVTNYGLLATTSGLIWNQLQWQIAFCCQFLPDHRQVCMPQSWPSMIAMATSTELKSTSHYHVQKQAMGM